MGGVVKQGLGGAGGLQSDVLLKHSYEGGVGGVVKQGLGSAGGLHGCVLL